MQLQLFFAFLFIVIVGIGYLFWRKQLRVGTVVVRTLRDSLEVLPIGIYVRYIKKEGKKQYLFSNSIAQAIYGCPDIFHAPNWNQEDDDEVDRALISEQKNHFYKEKTFYTLEKELKYVTIDKRILTISSNEYYVITSLQDITEQKRNQYLLEERDKDISLSAKAGRFFMWKYNAKIKEFAPLLGESEIESELNLKDVLTKIHPEDQQRFLGLLEGLIHAEEDEKKEEEDIILRVLNDTPDGFSYYKCKLCRRYDPIEKSVYIIGLQKDITQECVRDLELQSIRQSLNMAINGAHIIAWDYDISGRRYRHLYGEHETEPVIDLDGQFDRLHPDDRERYITFVKGFSKGDYPNDKGAIQIRMYNDERVLRHYKCIVQLTKDVANAPNTLIGIFIDITKQVEDEEIIKQNVHFLHTVLDNIPFPTHVKDITDGCKYTYWNKASKLLFGDCTGEKADWLLDAEQAEKIDSLDKAIYESENSYQEQERLRMLDGRVFDTIVYKNVIYDGAKKLILTVRWDIGEILKLQHYLEDVCRRNEIIINNTNSGLAYITPDYIVQWENISICTPDIVYETYKKGELCYKSAYKRDTPCEDCLLKRVMATKTIGQKSFLLDNGRHIEVLANPVLKGDEEIEGIVIKVDDVTDRQKMIEDLQDAKKRAEESDKLKSAFLANVSHEIRTPLNAIVGFSNLLLNSDDMTEKEQFTKIISNNNELLLRLINDILDLSKIEAGIIAPNIEEVVLGDLFSEIEASFIFKMNENVQLINEASRERQSLKTSPCCIRLALSHFIMNALKFTNHGCIKIGYEEVDDGVKYYVSDTGIGIRKEDQERIFERFEKVDSFTQGTGLGLTICKAIANSHKGKIGLESEVGKGSTFWIWFPNITAYK